MKLLKTEWHKEKRWIKEPEKLQKSIIQALEPEQWARVVARWVEEYPGEKPGLNKGQVAQEVFENVPKLLEIIENEAVKGGRFSPTNIIKTWYHNCHDKPSKVEDNGWPTPRCENHIFGVQSYSFDFGEVTFGINPRQDTKKYKAATR